MEALRILIFEDELMVAHDIRENLIKYGYEVSGIARTLEKALDILESCPTDILLVDIQLNGPLDGIEIVQRLSKQYSIPVIYLTAHSDMKVLNRAKQTNPSAYLIKPFRMAELPLQIELAIHNFYQHPLPNPNKKSDGFLLSVGGIFIRVFNHEIIYIEAKGPASQFHLTQAGYSRIHPHRKVELYANLGYLFDHHLTDNFYRLSKSEGINLDHVDGIEADEVLCSGHRISIPTGQRKILLERFSVIRSR
ncbi:hypothetical protein BWI96_10555 [Siphonobacter sp. SORGH_AS_0500]|uniref:response regulator n=1 Tax=Siphonobacter sp. SORGH_AS_0500 TaxID=1864824 RepID=UPI000CC70D4A|nr:response regulator [Siphonobacter sp. SORGH_AS_0500]PKK36802.1 hypothetical protein BWI96_10555 [Siphonobacter sp. SORGH_AS_0500]